MKQNRYLLFSSRIRQNYEKLTVSERRIADYMLSDPHAFLSATARSIAEELSISAATVIRACRAFGFDGFAEMKLIIRRDETEWNTKDGSKYVDVKIGDKIAVVREKVLGYHNMIINDMMSGWNEQAYDFAADAIINAKRIIVIGEGGSKCTAMCLFHIFTSIGLPCEMYNDPVFEIMKIGSLQPGDVAIGITFTGRLRDTVDSLSVAKKCGATTISFTGFPESPVTDVTDIIITTTRINKDYYDSAISIRVSEMMAAEILSTLVAMRLSRPIEPTISKEHVVSVRRIWDNQSPYEDIDH